LSVGKSGEPYKSPGHLSGGVYNNTDTLPDRNDRTLRYSIAKDLRYLVADNAAAKDQRKIITKDMPVIPEISAKHGLP
jgi:hypothetical protein